MRQRRHMHEQPGRTAPGSRFAALLPALAAPRRVLPVVFLAGLLVGLAPSTPLGAGPSAAAVADEVATAGQEVFPELPEAPEPPAVLRRQDDQPAPGALSPRNASYEIEARLDHATRTIVGTETIRWRNIGGAPTDTLRLHLYWNGWRNTSSTWLRDRQLAGGTSGAADREPGDWGYTDVTAIALVGQDGGATDLLPGFAYVQPDDGNADDRTLAAVALPAPVAPGETIAVRLSWTAHVPRTFSRTGALGHYYFIAQWFPKVAVYEDGAWTAHQFHANTEFFSDYGVYDVRLTVPTGWVVGATGVDQADTDNGDGTTTHRFYQEDVHDFAWTTSPDFLSLTRRFEQPGLPPVEMRLLLQPEHRGQEDRHFDATAAALRYYGEWYGPYPYDHITIVDPAWQSGTGGMEYPTLFTAGSRWLAPAGSNQPESVTVHEAGHQFWYAIVGNNEFEHAWMDEGLNTFSEERVQSIAFTPNYRVERFFGGFLPWQMRDIALDRATDGNGLNGYRGAAERDAPSTSTWRYWPGTHSQITYSKTALWLQTLERYLGWDTLQQAMSTYFERWKFRHPRPEDFFAVLNEVSGRDLTWFFDEVYRGSNVFDYGVERFESRRAGVRGMTDGPNPSFEDETSDTWHTTAVVRRFGEATFPVDVLVRFADGTEARETWDGRDRWHAYTWDRGVRAVSVQVDPDRVLLLDVDYTNNSRTLEPEADAASTKWALTWMVWVQDLMLTWGFFA
ncbi:MAG: M1 family metallopeptidase [Vicinamibacterales bacterium]